MTVALCRSSHQVLSFHGQTFEEALRAAADADAVNPVCIDKQIAFLRRTGGGPAATARSWSTKAPSHPASDATRFSDVTAAVAALLHETQLERGMSTLFVGSDGRLLHAELSEQRRRADERQQVLVALLGQAGAAPPPVLFHLDYALWLLSAVGGLRSNIDAGAVSPPRVIETFSEINAEFLSALETFMAIADASTRRPAALACLALLNAKEQAGIERAQLASALVADRFPCAHRLRVASLIAAQASYLHVFSATAPRRAKQMLRLMLASPAESEARRMESIAYGECDHGFGIDPATWFATMTRKIEMLGEVAGATLDIFRSSIS